MLNYAKFFLLSCATLNATAAQVEITWPASGNGYRDASGLLAQDEYVEWTRNYRNSNGSLQCKFYTDFNTSSKPYLTQDYETTKPDTRFNSITCLNGEVEPTGHTVGCRAGTGIVQHCWAGNTCHAPFCVPRRASDSTICRQLNDLRYSYSSIQFLGDIENARSASPRAKQFSPKIKLKIGRSLLRNCSVSHHLGTVVDCSFQASPYSSCDALAPDIKASVKLILN